MSVADLDNTPAPPRQAVSGIDRHRQLATDSFERAANRLGPKELRRRIWHSSPGFLPLLLWFVPHADPLSPTLRMICVLLAVGCGLAIYLKYRRIERAEDVGRLTSVIGYAGSVLATILLFPSALEIGLGVLAILAFGDGAATFGGKMLGGPRLPWNREKTWSGFCCFLAAGIPTSSVIYWRETHNLEAVGPGVSLSTALLCAGTATIAAAIFESIRSRTNDNIRVGVSAMVALAAMHAAVVGWH